MTKTIKIKQDRYDTVEEFKSEVCDAMRAVFNLARMGDDLSFSELANDLYILEFLLKDSEISID